MTKARRLTTCGQSSSDQTRRVGLAVLPSSLVIAPVTRHSEREGGDEAAAGAAQIGRRNRLARSTSVLRENGRAHQQPSKPRAEPPIGGGEQALVLPVP